MSLVKYADGELVEKILSSFQFSKNDLQITVRSLETWLRAQEKLPQYFNEGELTVFLVQSKGNIERAKQKITNYFTYRALYPIFFSNRDPNLDEIKNVQNHSKLGVLPDLSPEGSRAVFFKLHGPAENFVYAKLCKKFFMALDILLKTECYQSGIFIVADGSQMGFKQLLRCYPWIIKDFAKCLTTMFPYRVNRIILFNAFKYQDVFLNNFFKPVLPKKIAQRFIVVMEGPEEIYKYGVPQEMLPKDYGGKAPSLQQLNDTLNDALLENREWLLTKGSELAQTK